MSTRIEQTILDSVFKRVAGVEIDPTISHENIIALMAKMQSEIDKNAHHIRSMSDPNWFFLMNEYTRERMFNWQKSRLSEMGQLKINALWKPERMPSSMNGIDIIVNNAVGNNQIILTRWDNFVLFPTEANIVQEDQYIKGEWIDG